MNINIDEQFQKMLDTMSKKERQDFLKKQPQSVGQRLKEKRKEKKLTQEQVANVLGVTKQNIYNYEKGTATPPSKKLDLLCEIYDTTPSYILGIPESTESAVGNEIMEHLQTMHSITHDMFKVQERQHQKIFNEELNEKEWLLGFINDFMEELPIEQLYQIKDDVILKTITEISKK